MNKKKIMSVVASFTMITAYVTQTLTPNTNHKAITFSPLTAYADDTVTQEEYVVGASLVLDGSLKVNIKFNCDISTNDNWTINGKAFSTTMKKVSYAVPAKDFMNDIIIKHDSKTVHTFSVADMLTQYKANEKTKNIAGVLENYCKAAKDYFEDNIVADYSDSYESIKAEIGNHEIEMGDGYYASSLLLKSRTLLRHYYTKPVDGSTPASNGYYYIEEVISAHNYSDSDNYCVNDYIYKAISNPNASANLKNLCVALYNYGKAAAEYSRTPRNKDTDDDGLYDELERLVMCNPYMEDSDNNGVPDGDEDYDCDGISNVDELSLRICPYAKDSDYDGINDYDELYLHKTDPNNEDTDGDFIIDGDELILQTNLNDPITNDIKDNENTKEYKFADDSAQIIEFNTSDQPFRFSFDITAAGVVNKYIKVSETGYRNAISENPYIIGKSPCISYDENMKVDNVSVYFAMQDGYDEDISKYTVFYYWEGYNLLIPIETYYDNDSKTIYANNVFSGTYCLLNTAEMISALGNNGNMDRQAAPPVLRAPNTPTTPDDLNVYDDAAITWNGHEYFLITSSSGMTYDEAVGICAGYGGYPATVISEEENDVVADASDWNEVWLGAYVEKPKLTEYIIRWITGEEGSYECWRQTYLVAGISETDHIGSFWGLWAWHNESVKLNAVVCERSGSAFSSGNYDGLTFSKSDLELNRNSDVDTDGDGIPDYLELSLFDKGIFDASGKHIPANFGLYIDAAAATGMIISESTKNIIGDISVPSYNSNPLNPDEDDDDYWDNEDVNPKEENEDRIEILAHFDFYSDDQVNYNAARQLNNYYIKKGKNCIIRFFEGYDGFIQAWNRIGDNDKAVTGKYYYNVTDVILVAHGVNAGDIIPGCAISLGNGESLIPPRSEVSIAWGDTPYEIEKIVSCRRFDKLELLVCNSDNIPGGFTKSIAETFISHFPSIKKVYAFDCACELLDGEVAIYDNTGKTDDTGKFEKKEIKPIWLGVVGIDLEDKSEFDLYKNCKSEIELLELIFNKYPEYKEYNGQVEYLRTSGTSYIKRSDLYFGQTDICYYIRLVKYKINDEGEEIKEYISTTYKDPFTNSYGFDPVFAG